MRIANPMKDKEKDAFTAQRPGVFSSLPDLFDDLRSYRWIDSYNRKLAIQAELNDLKDLLRTTRGAFPSKSELLKFAKEKHSEYVEQRLELIQAAILNVSESSRNPFIEMNSGKLHCMGLGTQDFAGFVTWQEVESSIKRIDDATTMSMKEKAKAVKHIEGKIDALTKELNEIFPRRHNRFRQVGIRSSDVRAELIHLWGRVQKQIDAPVAPTGMDLRHSTPQEKAAHKRLGIDSFVDAGAPYRPYDPYPNRKD